METLNVCRFTVQLQVRRLPHYMEHHKQLDFGKEPCRIEPLSLFGQDSRGYQFTYKEMSERDNYVTMNNVKNSFLGGIRHGIVSIPHTIRIIELCRIEKKSYSIPVSYTIGRQHN